MKYDARRALELLRGGVGRPDAEFRDGQDDAIRHVVEGRGRLLVVQKTGWGKSFVYFIAAKLLREAGGGPALLISPLLSLMRNQLEAAGRMGVRAATINSDNVDDWTAVERRLAADEVDILLISPERLANETFETRVLTTVAARVSLLVVDEAHCVSDWGHDFRPHYRRVARVLTSLPPNLRLLATTATANQRVLADLASVLGPNLVVSRGDLSRPSLTLQTIRMPDQAERLAWLAAQLSMLEGSGIIYTLTIRDAAMVAEWLRSRGLEVHAYTGQSEDRPALEQALLENRVKALVATTALGMGFDKPDLAFVIHYQAPGSVVAYYQQVGRAGRALHAAYGVLLSGHEDDDITEFFIESALPTQDEVREVLTAIEAAPHGLSVPELMAHVNLSKPRIEKTLALLSLESPPPVVKVGPQWQLTAATLGRGFWERATRLIDVRRREQAQMQRYVALPDGHMDFLIRALDGEPRGLQPPRLPPLPTRVDLALVREAVTFLRRTNVPIEPRQMWPAGGLPRFGVSGKIATGFRAQAGKALCVWGDAGWGALVRTGKYQSQRFDDALVAASAGLIRAWSPNPAPSWVTCVPSLRHPGLVPDFAQRLAADLGLPFHAVLAKTEARPEQKTMANATQQARNVDGSMAITATVPAGAVLLVDDMVDSGWTLTIAAWLLRRAGSGEVWPFALARAGGGAE